MKAAAKILVIVTALWLFGNLLFFWANAIVDSYFYWAFAHYIKTGVYLFTYPFIYAKPTTISPPLYSLLLVLLAPGGAFAVRLIQTALLISSGIMIYRILVRYTSPAFAAIASCFFILIPANTIYVNYLLSEILAQWCVTLIAYLALQREASAYAKALFWTAIATVTKYSLVIYAIPSLILFLLSRPKRKLLLYPLMGACILGLWIGINWKITGIVGLSDTKGIQLYNQLVWIGEIAPDEHAPPVIELRRFIPPSVDLRQAYWDLQGYILPLVENRWPEVDRLLGAVAQDTLRRHPFSYIGNSVIVFFALHGRGLPYWHNLTNFEGNAAANPLFCGTLGSFRMCIPAIRSAFALPLWRAFIGWSDVWYENIFPIVILLVFFPSWIGGFFSKSPVRKRLSILYALGVIPIAMYVHPDTRYLIPFYPLMVLIIAFSVHGVIAAAAKRKEIRQ